LAPSPKDHVGQEVVAVPLGDVRQDDRGDELLGRLDELAKSDRPFTLATLCIGGGQGGAMLLERAS
jgi:hypothetical protein